MSVLCRVVLLALFLFFFFNDTATTEIYTLSLHDALPIFQCRGGNTRCGEELRRAGKETRGCARGRRNARRRDRKSTRLNSSHTVISYAVFCLKKKNIQKRTTYDLSQNLSPNTRDSTKTQN